MGKTCALSIFTFKQGLLSGFGHNLLFRCEAELQSERLPHDLNSDSASSLELKLDPLEIRLQGAVVGEPPTSLAMAPSRITTESLSDEQSQQVLDAMRRDVLNVSRYPMIRVVGGDPSEGTQRLLLSLCGVTADVKVNVRRQAEQWVGELELQPSRFNIKPYRAMLGALKLQDRVRVEFALDA